MEEVDRFSLLFYYLDTHLEPLSVHQRRCVYDWKGKIVDARRRHDKATGISTPIAASANNHKYLYSTK